VNRERLHAYSVKYTFNQPLPVPADVAFNWCTDYKPNDLEMMKEKGERRILRITSDTILLTETTRKRNRLIRKTKLVRLNKPALAWTNTHVAGPNRHSQFLYEIVPEGRSRSQLRFKGLLVHYSKRALRPEQLRKIARAERQTDSTAWHHLAAALQRETARR
jgi:hypothetical protein